MALATSNKSIKIRDNIVDIGFSSTGSVAANYTYTGNITTNGDSIINGNTFSGCIGNAVGSTTLMSLGSGSCIVTNNNFIRGVGSPIFAYISSSGGVDQIIKDNFFDQSTVDGTTETLVTGLTARSVYYGNKNQIGYVPIATNGGLFTTDTANFDIISDTSASVSTNSGYISVFFNTLTVRFFEVNFDLNSILPESVRVLGIKIGIYNIFIGSATLTSGTFSLDLIVRDIAAANYATGINSILDSKNKASTQIDSIGSSIDLAANLAASQAATLYAELDTTAGDDPDNFINSKDKAMILQVSISNDLASLGAGMDWVISPAIVKFVW